MKRIFAAALTLLMLLGVLSSCTLYRKMFGYNTEFTGPVYYMYFGEMPSSLDPADAYLNDASMAIMSMIYEGLYKYDEKGSVTEGLAQDCRKLSFDENTGELELEITIRDSRWNDHTHVQAEQFISAWRRILDPKSSSPAAVLLYDIKNAKEIKTATAMTTKFDLGVSAVDTRVLHITLAGQKQEDGSYAEPSISAFKEKLASPMLVPIREDMISKLADWASNGDTIVCNGPFYLRSFTRKEDRENEKEKCILLQRNVDYKRDDEIDPLDTYVKPYQILVRYTLDADLTYNDKGKIDSATPVFKTASEQALYYFDHNSLDYLSYIPLEVRGEYKDKVTLSDSLFTHSYLFNTKNPLLAKPEVRLALSEALDREALAERLVFADPALSIVAPAAKEPGSDDAFNDHLTNGVKKNADIDKAKSLLAQAGVSGGSFNLVIKADDENAAAAAAYCKEVWEQLGFSVSIVTLSLMEYKNEVNNYTGYYDVYAACYKANGAPYNQSSPAKLPNMSKSGFDVIALDLFTNSTDPFTTYASFSKYYSGMALDMTLETEEFEPALPMSSYDSNRYNACIDAAFKTPVKTSKAAYLHAADEQLMQDMPIMPLIRVQNSYMAKSSLNDLRFTLGGVPDFSIMSCSNYEGTPFKEIQAAIIKERKDELG